MSAFTEMQSLMGRKLKLLPADVVDWARSRPDSALHSRLEWDDDEASEKWRVHQARNIIRTYQIEVRYPKMTADLEGTLRVRGLVSLHDDRASGGGYRKMVAVMENVEMREKLLAEAKADFERLKAKWKTLVELEALWEAGDAVFGRL